MFYTLLHAGLAMCNIKIFLHTIEIPLLVFFFFFLFFPIAHSSWHTMHVTFPSATMIFCFLLDIDDSLSLKNLMDNGEMDLFHHLMIDYLL